MIRGEEKSRKRKRRENELGCIVSGEVVGRC